MTHFDVIIVGAGMAGSALAVALCQQQNEDKASAPLSIALIERQSLQSGVTDFSHAENGLAPSVESYDLRMSALTYATIDWLESLGVWEAIRQQGGSEFVGMDVWVEDGTGSIGFDAEGAGGELLGEIVENRALVSVLLDTARAHDNVTVIDGAEISELQFTRPAGTFTNTTPGDQGVTLTLGNGDLITADLLVAADGARSQIRLLAGMDVRRWNYGHDAIVCNVEMEKPHKAIAYQRFTKTGPAAFLPLNSSDEDSSLCSIVWSQTCDRAAELMELDEDSFAVELAASIEHRLGDVVALSQRQSFPLSQMHALDYQKKAVVLVADAAHTIHPLAGQGINLGLADVAELASTILEARASGKSVADQTLLKRYQRRRKTDNLAMMALVEGFKQIYQPLPLPITLLRNEGMKLLDRHTMLKKKVTRYAMGLDGR